MREAIAAGIAYCSDDRKRDGIFGVRRLIENLTAPAIDKISVGGVLSERKEDELGRRLAEFFEISLRRLNSQAGKLSGGNQQKVALGKWLGIDPAVLLVEEPTRGVDVGARAEIYRHLRTLANQGLAILFVSSDNQEVLGLADTRRDVLPRAAGARRAGGRHEARGLAARRHPSGNRGRGSGGMISRMLVAALPAEDATDTEAEVAGAPHSQRDHRHRRDRRPAGRRRADDAELPHLREPARRHSRRLDHRDHRARHVLHHDFRQSVRAVGRGTGDPLGLRLRLPDARRVRAGDEPGADAPLRRGVRRDTGRGDFATGADPIITTLAFGAFFRGVASLVTNNKNILLGTKSAEWLGTARPLGIPTQSWAFVILALLAWFVLQKTRFGRQLVLIGANRQAAKATGLRVGQASIVALTLFGICCGMAGIFGGVAVRPRGRQPVLRPRPST